MNAPLATAEKSLREQLQEFFEQSARQSFDRSMECLNRVNFYDEVLARVEAGKDITDEVPEAKGKSSKKVISVAKAQRKVAASESLSAWELSPAIAKCFRTTIRSVEAESELIPQFDVEHVAKTEQGQVCISVKTWRRNLDVVVAGEDQAIDAVHAEMTFAALKA